MTENRVPDGRPPRRDESITHASSHPELSSGDLAMTPRLYASPAAVNQATTFTWSLGSLSIFSIFAVTLLLSSTTYNHSAIPDGAEAEKPRLARTCTQWHLAASTGVSRLVHSTRDADLRQVNDSIFRMRRARRNCEAGWFELACQDYFAVAASTPGYVTPPSCSPAGGLPTLAMIGIDGDGSEIDQLREGLS